MPSDRPVKVIIDTDIGDDVDDALAIAFAMLRPELDVRAITTVYGPARKRVQLLARFVGVIAQAKGIDPDRLPLLAMGESLPLTRFPPERTSELIRRTPNQYPFAEMGGPAALIQGLTAIEVFEKVINENARDIALVTIGPMTNAAKLVQTRDDLARKLRLISIMGGSYQPGFAEYNIACDPVAAKAVFRSPVATAQFSCEVTNRVVMRDKEMTELRAAKNPIAQALCQLINLWWPHKGSTPGPVIYDMSPLLWLFQPEIYAVEKRGVDVVTEFGPNLGRTVPAFGSMTSVATDIDAGAAMRLFIDTVCNG